MFLCLVGFLLEETRKSDRNPRKKVLEARKSCPQPRKSSKKPRKYYVNLSRIATFN